MLDHIVHVSDQERTLAQGGFELQSVHMICQYIIGRGRSTWEKLDTNESGEITMQLSQKSHVFLFKVERGGHHIYYRGTGGSAGTVWREGTPLGFSSWVHMGSPIRRQVRRPTLRSEPTQETSEDPGELVILLEYKVGTLQEHKVALPF